MKLVVVDELPDSFGRKTGWAPPPEMEAKRRQEEHPYEAEPHLEMPPIVDLRPHMPPIYDQGDLNSCTSNAVGGMIQYLRAKQGMNAFLPSRQYLYWYQRLADNTQNQNIGCSVYSAINVAQTMGYCPENYFPYNPNWQLAPPPPADQEAHHHQVGPHRAPASFEELKLALANGFPVAFGFYFFNSFYAADLNNGLVPMNFVGPVQKHAALVVGYSDAAQTVTVRNSWGVARNGRPCGDQGYYYMPYQYISDGQLCSEFWTLAGIVDQP